MPKSLSKVQEFMDRGPLAGFATVNREDQPDLVPVFFTYENACIIRGEGRVVEDDDEFARRTEDHVEEYRLKLDR